MPAIFISHSNLDRRASEELGAKLKGFGFEQVFLDFDKETGIGAGEDWEKRLYEEILQASQSDTIRGTACSPCRQNGSGAARACYQQDRPRGATPRHPPTCMASALPMPSGFGTA